jgi:PAS domain-containing protein
MPWLNSASLDVLRFWIRETPCPMLVVAQDSRILWCNPAFEHLCDYSLVEFTRPDAPVNIDSLITDRSDSDAYRSLVTDCLSGFRPHFQLTLSLRRKNAASVTAIAHFLRVPSQGDMQYSIVTLYPLEKAATEVLSELQAIRAALDSSTGVQFSKLVEWADKNPRKAALLILIVCGAIFGTSFFDIAQRALSILRASE